MSDKIKLVTHSGRFHADDTFATATLLLLFSKTGQGYELVRSRDPKDNQVGDIVYDTGNKYSPDEKFFDHHQEGGAGKRQNDVPYAAFGLIWKHYGYELIEKYFDSEKIDNDDLMKIHELVDKNLVQPIDAADTGYEDYKSSKNDDLRTYILDNVAKDFNPTNTEGYEKSTELFMRVVEINRQILERHIIKAKNKVNISKRVVEHYNKSEDKRIVILDDGGSWRDVLIEKPEPLYVIFPTVDNDGWMIQAVHMEQIGYEVRKPFPNNWRGKTNEELEKETGITGSKFCHQAGFLCVAETKNGAIELAKKSIVDK